MNRPEILAILDQVLTLLLRSFPQYLAHARPYIPFGRDEVMEVMADIGAGQTLLARRITERIDALGGAPSSGEFPMEFTDSHDLSIDYLLDLAIERQAEDIRTLRKYSERLELAAGAKSLVDEAIGMARGHLEALEECVTIKQC